MYLTVVVGLLLVLVVEDQGRIDRRDAWLRVATGLLVSLITVVNAVSTIRLVDLIITNTLLGSADRLLGSGAAIWLTNVIAFGLWYSDLDQGGAAERASGKPDCLRSCSRGDESGGGHRRLVSLADRLPAYVVRDLDRARPQGRVRNQALVQGHHDLPVSRVSARIVPGRRPSLEGSDVHDPVSSVRAAGHEICSPTHGWRWTAARK